MPQKQEWVRRDVHIRSSAYKELEKMKEKSGLPVSYFMRLAIDKYIEEKKK